MPEEPCNVCSVSELSTISIDEYKEEQEKQERKRQEAKRKKRQENKKKKQTTEKPKAPPTAGIASQESAGPVVIVNGNPLQKTASGGLSILLDTDAAKAISLIMSSALEINFEIAPDTTLSLELLEDGGVSFSASNPIKIDYTGPIDVRLSSVTFNKEGIVTSTEATYPLGPMDINVSSSAKKEINKTIRNAIYGEGLGAVIDPLPQIVRRATASLYGRKSAPLKLTFEARKKK